MKIAEKTTGKGALKIHTKMRLIVYEVNQWRKLWLTVGKFGISFCGV